jgi:hypothetical protein
MAEKLLYYLLALTLAGDFFLIYNTIVTALRSKRERRERERLRAAQSEIKRLQASGAREQQEALEAAGWNSPHGVDLDLIKQLETELNQRVVELEREL